MLSAPWPKLQCGQAVCSHWRAVQGSFHLLTLLPGFCTAVCVQHGCRNGCVRLEDASGMQPVKPLCFPSRPPETLFVIELLSSRPCSTPFRFAALSSLYWAHFYFQILWSKNCFGILQGVNCDRWEIGYAHACDRRPATKMDFWQVKHYILHSEARHKLATEIASPRSQPALRLASISSSSCGCVYRGSVSCGSCLILCNRSRSDATVSKALQVDVAS